MKTVKPENTLSRIQIPEDLQNILERTLNPWWQNRPMSLLPPFRRWLFDTTLKRLKSGLAPVTVLRGPRQVGKTTLQEQIIHYLLYEEKIDPKRIFRIQFDQLPPLKDFSIPILTICYWFEENILGTTFNEQARKGEIVYLFLDEVQNLPDWSPQIKTLVDHHSIRVLLTGSSALKLELGRDSLAGRISTLEMGALLLREIAFLRGFGEIEPLMPLNGINVIKSPEFWNELREHGIRHKEIRDNAFSAFSDRGGYPIAQVRAEVPWEELADQLNETVIRRVIQHDLRIGKRKLKKDENLLEELFRISCRYAGQSPRQSTIMDELHSALSINVDPKRVLDYLRFLNNSLLIRLIPPLEIRLKKRKGASSKICLSDHSLRASWLQEVIPIEPEELLAQSHLTDLAGHIAESVVGYFLSGIPNLDIAWFPERETEPEVDFVITVGESRIPVEVKYRRYIDPNKDIKGLISFIEKKVYNASFGILITLLDGVKVSDPRIIALPLSSLLLMR